MLTDRRSLFLGLVGGGLGVLGVKMWAPGVVGQLAARPAGVAP